MNISYETSDHRNLIAPEADWLAGAGKVHTLEKKFSELLGGMHALGVCNATQGLFACFLALDIRNAEIITTPYTWAGTLSGMLILGNEPRFCDIDPRTLTLNPAEIENKLNDKTRAILTVDIYGNPSHAAALREIADAHGIWLIQDCSQSLGARYLGRQSGSWADAVVFSLSAGKPLCCGEGGVVLTPHRDLYEKIVFWTQHPDRQRRDLPTWPENAFALNMRLHPMAAQQGVHRFWGAMQAIRSRQQEHQKYEAILEDEFGIKPISQPGYEPSFHRYTLDLSYREAKNAVDLLKKTVNIHATLNPPPIHTLIYDDIIYSHQWRHKIQKCAIAEEQIKHRIWMQFQKPI